MFRRSEHFQGASTYAFGRGLHSIGADDNSFVIFSDLMDSKSLFLTAKGRWLPTPDGVGSVRSQNDTKLLLLERHSVRPMCLNMGICAAVLLAVFDCLACCSLRAWLRTGPPNYATVLFLRDRYREISGFACRDHNFWINPALNANPFQSELLNRSPRNIIVVVIVLEMLKLLALPLAAIHGNDCVGLCY